MVDAADRAGSFRAFPWQLPHGIGARAVVDGRWIMNGGHSLASRMRCLISRIQLKSQARHPDAFQAYFATTRP
jgi:hypothetical protein